MIVAGTLVLPMLKEEIDVKHELAFVISSIVDIELNHDAPLILKTEPSLNIGAS